MGGAIPGITGGVNITPIAPSIRGFLADGSPSLIGLTPPGQDGGGQGEYKRRETQSWLGVSGSLCLMKHQLNNMYVYVYVIGDVPDPKHSLNVYYMYMYVHWMMYMYVHLYSYRKLVSQCIYNADVQFKTCMYMYVYIYTYTCSSTTNLQCSL